jgi:phosphatidylethanolamine/phosphatidyl-N-methylethanolamine N-methyltransferase
MRSDYRPCGNSRTMNSMRQRWADYRVFWRQFRETYHSTGAVLPSGRALSAALAHYVRDGASQIAVPLGDSDAAVPARLPNTGRRILEVGPGTGAVTAHIVREMRGTDQLVLVERNDEFVAWLRRRLAEAPEFQNARDRITLVHAAVEDLPEGEPFDLIISGLPLNNFSAESVEQILAKLRRLLAPGGVLSFFEYVAIRRAKSVVSRRVDRARLRSISRLFHKVLGKYEVRRDLVLANVPPAWVHHVRFVAKCSG